MTKKKVGRYALFAFDYRHPYGGMNDLVDTFPMIEGAKKHVKDTGLEASWICIVDLHTLEEVWNNAKEFDAFI